jgi:hypothetical protein
MKAANVGSCSLLRNSNFMAFLHEIWHIVQIHRKSQDSWRVCRKATHAENDRSSSQILCLKVKIFFYCKQTTLPYQGSADSDARCLSEWVTPDEY